MPCQFVHHRPRTLGEMFRAAGCDDSVLKAQGRENDMAHDYGPIMSCGEAPLLPVCACGYVADLLCDYPMGDGKTCDLNLCSACAREVGVDQHFCDVHLREFQAKAGVPWTQPWIPSPGPWKPTLVK